MKYSCSRVERYRKLSCLVSPGIRHHVSDGDGFWRSVAARRVVVGGPLRGKKAGHDGAGYSTCIVARDCSPNGPSDRFRYVIKGVSILKPGLKEVGPPGTRASKGNGGVKVSELTLAAAVALKTLLWRGLFRAKAAVA